MEDENREITISLELYNTLLERSARIAVFEEYVNSEKWTIPREMCGRILGFNVRKVDGDD